MCVGVCVFVPVCVCRSGCSPGLRMEAAVLAGVTGVCVYVWELAEV